MNQKLYDVLLPAVRVAFTKFVKSHPGEHVYGVNLYTSGEYSYLAGSVLTVEGLRSVAEQYLQEESYQEEWKTVEKGMAELKWSAPDSPWHDELEGHFGKVDKLLEKLMADSDDDDEFTARCREVHETAVAVLRAIREEGIFTGDGIVFNVVMGDMSHEECYLNAEDLNPPKVLARLKSELEIDEVELSSQRESRWEE